VAAARAASSSSGGGWAIPAYVVQCESGGQNLPPNSAGASGYYQIIASTWQGYGGGRYAPQAYQATAQQQGMIASRIWDGGAGAQQWVCAGG
jgi:muramidase (phage lysozyme)